MLKAYISFLSFLPVLFPTSHAFFINRSFQFPEGREDGLMIDYDGFDDLVDMSLAGHWILPIWNMHQGWSEADG